jgi:hypothetical protein
MPCHPPSLVDKNVCLMHPMCFSSCGGAGASCTYACLGEGGRDIILLLKIKTHQATSRRRVSLAVHGAGGEKCGRLGGGGAVDVCVEERDRGIT